MFPEYWKESNVLVYKHLQGKQESSTLCTQTSTHDSRIFASVSFQGLGFQFHAKLSEDLLLAW